MIDWLGGWLKDVVMIILLATFIDLMIPNHSLQRYVKVVVSLILLLTILSPVISLFKAERNIFRAAELAAGSGGAGTVAATGGAAGGAMPSLQQLLEAGSGMKREAEAETRALVERELAGMMRTDLEQQLGVAVSDLEVRLGGEGAGDRPAIASVRVELAETGADPEGSGGAGDRASASDPAPGMAANGPAADKEGREGRITAIEPVRPVDIRIRTEGKAETAGPAAETLAQRPPASAIERRVIAHLKQTWGVAEEQILLNWSSGR